MNLKNWLQLFWTTLVVGAVASLIVGIYFQWVDVELQKGFFAYYMFNLGQGLMYSVLSQMGFFAYLTFNYIAQGFFSRKGLWAVIQWIVIIVGFVDSIALRTMFFEDNKGWLLYSILPVLMIVVAWACATWKVKMTNAKAFTPTMFFMFVVTLLEAVPVLRLNNADSTTIMVVPLLACNAWQILRLHKLVKPANVKTAVNK